MNNKLHTATHRGATQPMGTTTMVATTTVAAKTPDTTMTQVAQTMPEIEIIPVATKIPVAATTPVVTMSLNISRRPKVPDDCMTLIGKTQVKDEKKGKVKRLLL